MKSEKWRKWQKIKTFHFWLWLSSVFWRGLLWGVCINGFSVSVTVWCEHKWENSTRLRAHSEHDKLKVSWVVSNCVLKILFFLLSSVSNSNARLNLSGRETFVSQSTCLNGIINNSLETLSDFFQRNTSLYLITATTVFYPGEWFRDDVYMQGWGWGNKQSYILFNLLAFCLSLGDRLPDQICFFLLNPFYGLMLIRRSWKATILEIPLKYANHGSNYNCKLYTMRSLMNTESKAMSGMLIA